jgi:hypothetical protein
MTPLMQSSRYGYLDVTRFLLESKANLDARSEADVAARSK